MLARSTPEAMPQLQNVTHALWARRGCVARDHPQVVRERAHFGERRPAVVDRGRLGEDRRCSPRRASAPSTPPCRPGACRWSRLNGASRSWRTRSSCGSRRTCADGSMPGLPGKTIGSSGAWWEKRVFSMKFTPTRSAREIPARSSPVFGLPPAMAAGPSAVAIASMSAPTVISATPLIASLPRMAFPTGIQPLSGSGSEGELLRRRKHFVRPVAQVFTPGNVSIDATLHRGGISMKRMALAGTGGARRDRRSRRGQRRHREGRRSRRRRSSSSISRGARRCRRTRIRRAALAAPSPSI